MFSKDEISSRIVKWFSKKFNQNIDISENYLDSGFIDSFEIIELISFIESTYKIKFSSNDFKDSRFYSLNGLSDLIIEKIPII